MLLLQSTGVEKAFGERAVLRGASLSVGEGERIGLVGANGCGKSTLLRILGGAMTADHGRIHRSRRHALLDQDPVLPGTTVGEALDESIAWHRQMVAEFEQSSARGDATRSAALQDELDRHGWDLSHSVAAMADRLGTPPRDALVAQLSGGELRRVALARVLLGSPDLLLLDEPTNHLDAETIDWLEGWLQSWRGAVVIVTHDRYLLEAVATRIVEVDAGECVSYDGAYADYLLARAERQARLERDEGRHLSFLAREAEWASRSPAARSTKQKARLQRLDALSKVQRLERNVGMSLDLRTGQKLGGPLLELRGVSKSYGGPMLLDKLDLVVRAGERVGVLGPNGAGKSTLLSVISGALEPDRGERITAPRLLPAVLDQSRTGLCASDSVYEAAGGGNDHVFVGQNAIHVASFLRRFQFHRDRHDQPVSSLSGGEQARLLMARLLLQGANLLLLDEPTNDLDLLTLRILEEALLAYDGAVVVVSHDRAFLDRVCTQVLAFEGDGVVQQYATRLQYVAALQKRRAAVAAEDKAQLERAARALPAAPRAAPSRARKGLSYKEKREFEALPGQIEALEEEQEAVGVALGDPSLYRDRADELPALTARSEALPIEIEAMYARWEELEARAG